MKQSAFLWSHWASALSFSHYRNDNTLYLRDSPLDISCGCICVTHIRRKYDNNLHMDKLLDTTKCMGIRFAAFTKTWLHFNQFNALVTRWNHFYIQTLPWCSLMSTNCLDVIWSPQIVLMVFNKSLLESICVYQLQLIGSHLMYTLTGYVILH